MVEPIKEQIYLPGHEKIKISPTPLIDGILARLATVNCRRWPRMQVTISEDTIPDGYGVSMFEQGPDGIHISMYRKDGLKHAVSCDPHRPFFIHPENDPCKPNPIYQS